MLRATPPQRQLRLALPHRRRCRRRRRRRRRPRGCLRRSPPLPPLATAGCRDQTQASHRCGPPSLRRQRSSTPSCRSRCSSGHRRAVAVGLSPRRASRHCALRSCGGRRRARSQKIYEQKNNDANKANKKQQRTCAFLRSSALLLRRLFLITPLLRARFRCCFLFRLYRCACFAVVVPVQLRPSQCALVRLRRLHREERIAEEEQNI